MLWQMAKAFARAAAKKRQNPITRQINKYIDDPNTTRVIGSDDYMRGTVMAKERADKQRGSREDGTPYKKPVTDIEAVNLAEGWDEALEQAFRRAASMEVVRPLRKLSDSHKAFIDEIVDDVVAKRVAPADVTSASGIIKNYPQLKDIELRRTMEGVRSHGDWRPRWINGTPFKPWTKW